MLNKNIDLVLLASEITITIIACSVLLLVVILIILKILNVHKKNVKQFEGMDFLTKKYNQTGFILELEKIKKIDKWTVICFDVDNFKQINYNNSYKFGDEVIIDISNKLSNYLSDNGIVGRIESNRFLIGYPQNYIPVLEMISQISNILKVIEINYIRLELQYTFGYYSNYGEEKIESITFKAVDEWVKAKKEKINEKYQNIDSKDSIEIANLAENAKSAQHDANIKLELAQNTLVEAQKSNENAEAKLEKSNKMYEEATSLKMNAESLMLEAKSIKLEGENNINQAKLMLEEANRIRTEAENLRKESLKLKEEVEQQRKENLQKQIELEKESYDSKRELEEALEIKRAYEGRAYKTQREYEKDNYKEQEQRISYNNKDELTEKRVEEIINTYLKKQQEKPVEEKHLTASEIELMIRRIIMEFTNKENEALKQKDTISLNDTERLTTEELKSAIQSALSEYINEEYKEKQTKKEKLREEEEKENITNILARLVELEEKSKENNISKKEIKNDVYTYAEPEIDDEEDEDDEEEETISNEYLQQLDSKLDINKFEKLMDEYMQKYQQHDSSEIQITSPEKAKMLSFIERVNISSRDSKTYYNMIKNAIMQHEGVVNVITNRYDTFKVGKKVLFKIAYVGKTLKLYLPLDPSIYPNGQFPHKDVSDKKKHINTPFMMKIRSNLGLKRALVLIDDAMIKLSLNKISNYKNADFVARNRNLIMKMNNN